MADTAAAGTRYAAALYLALVQFLFVTCWTLYVIFLPGLLESAGLPRRYAPWILMLDQLVFLAMDVLTGLAADRVAGALRRLGPLILGITAVSCAAFLLIPHAVHWGKLAPVAALTLVIVWAATSSALRAPPWVLLSRHAATSTLPWVNALALTGLALGGAVAPYLGIAMKNLDPRLPFAVSSLTLCATTAGLIWVERMLSQQAPVPLPPAAAPARLGATAWLFLAGCLLLAQGFQIHFSLNSAVQYLRFASPEQLQYLMPVFWIGFNIAMFPGAALAQRHGAMPVIAAAALAGAAGALASARAPDLDTLIAAQAVTGGAWGCALMACFTAATQLGRAGREGLALGLLFAALAGATLARMAAVVAELNRHPGLAPALDWVPFVLWFAAALLFAGLAAAAARRASPG